MPTLTVTNDNLIIRPARSGYCIWLGFVLLFCFLSFLVAIRRGDWHSFIICTGLIPLTIYLIGWRRIKIDSGTLTVQRPFRAKKEIHINRIKAVALKVGGRTYTEGLLPPFRLEFTLDECGKDSHFWINAKFYSMKDIRLLERLLVNNKEPEA